jgi:hypothetical protein
VLRPVGVDGIDDQVGRDQGGFFLPLQWELVIEPAPIVDYRELPQWQRHGLLLAKQPTIFKRKSL